MTPEQITSLGKLGGAAMLGLSAMGSALGAGAASLAAALHPADADDLFFVATGSGDGRHTLSTTLAAHNAAVAGYVARQRQKVQQR